MGERYPASEMIRPGWNSLLIMVGWLVAACAATGGPKAGAEPTGIEITGAVIRNELAYPVSDVEISVPATGNFISCGHIMARSACATGFPVSEYRAHEVIVKWKEHGEPYSTGEFVIELTDRIVPGRPTRLEVVVFAPGQAGAKLVQ